MHVIWGKPALLAVVWRLGRQSEGQCQCQLPGGVEAGPPWPPGPLAVESAHSPLHDTPDSETAGYYISHPYVPSNSQLYSALYNNYIDTKIAVHLHNLLSSCIYFYLCMCMYMYYEGHLVIKANVSKAVG